MIIRLELEIDTGLSSDTKDKTFEEIDNLLREEFLNNPWVKSGRIIQDSLEQLKFDGQRAWDDKQFEQMWLGSPVKPKCAVRNFKHKHCPEEPKHQITFLGSSVWLCTSCYRGFLDGVFSQDRIKVTPKSRGLFINNTQVV